MVDKKTILIHSKVSWARKSALAIIGLFFVMTLAVWSYYFYKKKELYQKTQERMVSIAKNRSERILDHVKKYTIQGQLRAAEPFLIEEMARLRDVKPEEVSSPATIKKEQKLITFLEEKSTELTFNNTIIITPDGLVVFAHSDKNYSGKNVSQLPYSGYALGESFMRAKMSLTTDISDFDFDPLLNRPVLFVTIPILHNEKLLGMLVQRVPREPIYAIGDDYIGLGSTGDITLTDEVEDGLVFLSRIRTENTQPLKRFIALDKTSDYLFPVQLASQGDRGQGLTMDFLQDTVFAAWRYVPKVNWGIVTKITEKEVLGQLNHIRLLGFGVLILFILILLIVSFYLGWFGPLLRSVNFYLHVWWIRTILFLFLLITIVWIAYSFMNQWNINLEQFKTLGAKKVQYAAENIDYYLHNSEITVANLAYDLGANRINKYDLLPRIKREFSEHADLQGIMIAYQPYEYSKEKKLYAPFFKRTKNNDVEIRYIDESYDYTQEQLSVNEAIWAHAGWYRKALENKEITIFEPYQDPELYDQLIIKIAVPFYNPADKEKQHPMGVVAYLFNSNSITKIVEQISLGDTGFAYLLAKDGRFMVYPIKNFINDQRTGQELAGELGSPSLLRMTNEALSGKSGFGFYDDKTFQQRMWAYYSPVSSTGWPLILIFSQQELKLPPLIYRHYWIWLLVLVGIGLFFLIWIGMKYAFITSNILYFFILIESALLLAFFIIIRASPIIRQPEKAITILDQVHLRQFVNERDRYARHIDEREPVEVPCGIYLYSLNFSKPTQASVSGYVWLKYPDTLAKELMKEPQFPQVIGGTNLQKSYETHEKGFTIMGWQFTFDLAQSFDFVTYPFDTLNFVIELEHPDLSQHIVFVPAFEDYRDLRPEKLPGIHPGLTVTGFGMKKSYFSFFKESGESNFGLQSFQNTPDRYYLGYTLILQRYLFYELIVFVLPLFIVLLLLYALSWVAEKEWLPIMILSGYTGLLFSTILLHRTLRARFMTGDVLYLEYLFFMIYLTIVLLVLYLVHQVYFKGRVSYISKAFRMYKTYFWPIQLMILFIITALIFYNP